MESGGSGGGLREGVALAAIIAPGEEELNQQPGEGHCARL